MKLREHSRYIVEFPATFSSDSEGVSIVYNLGMGGCKMVTDRPLTVDAMLSMNLKIPKQALPITIRMAQVRWTLKYDFGVEFLEMEEIERERLAQYLQGLASAAA